MNVFLTGNLGFQDESLLSTLGLTHDEYIDKLVNNWNSLVTLDDSVIILENSDNKHYPAFKKIVPILNGKKFFLPKERDKRALWQWVGFDNVWIVDFYYPTIINGQETRIWFSNEKRKLKENEFCCYPEQDLSLDVFDGQYLGISIAQWDISPISINTIVEVIKNYVEN